MTPSVELHEAGGQQLRMRLLRTALTWLFRGLVRPSMPIAGQRAVLRALTVAQPLARGVRLEAGRLGGVACEWLRPANAGEHYLLYMHGGAYLIGSPATHRTITSQLALLSGAQVCALDYSLAPEQRYPAALDDVLGAYADLLAQGVPARQISLAGDSAGAHLALSAALALKSRGLPLPAALVLFSPLTDATLTQLHAPAAGDPLLSRAWITQGITSFCPPQMPRGAPELSPLYDDLAGLPPLLIQVGEDELLRNDSLRLAERATDAGVTVRLQRFVGCWHVFQAHAGLLAVADQALADAARFLRSACEQPVAETP